MKLYFAPLEGLGGYVYRNAQADQFARADKYFAPFLSPGAKKRLTPKTLRDITPEHNRNVNLVPQVLTNDAQAFVETARELSDLGYREVNLNLGCPSRAVVNKGRGAGFLADPDALDRFFDAVFSGLHISSAGNAGGTVDSVDGIPADMPVPGDGGICISVKTRLGMRDPGEFVHLLDIFNRYPIAELTIHPRIQTDYYRNHPNTEMFAYAVEHAEMPLVYNGDIFSVTAFKRFSEDFPDAGAVMLGRGVICDPALFGEIRGEEKLTKERLWAFHERLLSDYSEVLSGDSHVLFKMKELWYYLSHVFTDSEKYAKAIKKAQKMRDYREAVSRLFGECEIQESDFPARAKMA